MLSAPMIVTAWDNLETDEDDASMGYWLVATDFEGKWGGAGVSACCHVCGCDLDTHKEVAAAMIKPHAEDPELLLVRRVCRRCAPDASRARTIAASLVPDGRGFV